MGDGGFYALVLAAGAGTRFGGGKLHAAYQGAALVEAAIGAALAAPVVAVVIVVQPGQETAPWASGERRLAIPCPDWREGMAASLRCGVEALPKDAAGAFIFLGDMPRVPVSILPALAEAVVAGALAALPVFEGRDGHPVAFAAAVFPELLKLQGDRGARTVISALGERAVRIPTLDPGVLIDVDTPVDLDRLKGDRLQGDAAPPIASA